MDNRYIGKVIAEMEPFFSENKFENFGENCFKNDKKAVKVEYSDARQMYLLLTADIDEEGNIGEYIEAEAWLFDDSQLERDAESVGIDFVDTLRKNMGIKVKKTANNNIDLPTAKKGDKYNITSFTKKTLDTYPQLKEPYKEYVAKYGNFLYLNFFGTYLVPLMKETLKEGNKKSLKKILDMVEPAYMQGDKDSVNTAVACLAAACYGDEAVTAAVNNMLSENAHFKSAVNEFIPIIKSKKQIRETLVK
ncbi:MAG: hypothetical protein MJ090_03365 [Clostridia bacterium]|nr:hypothetical protein [Clostridia bacterium]